jgi:hypothetical protein
VIWDTFMYHDEADILECRLYELERIPNLRHVVVEADVTHQDKPKDSYFLDQRERFAPWADRIVHVWATGLPTAKDAPDPWAREHAQREHTWRGLTAAAPDDVVLHGDVDEIPTVLAARNVRPQGFVAFEQRGHFWAVDWLYPPSWRGTVAARLASIKSFGAMRDMRNVAKPIPMGGWHLSWLGGPDRALHKVGSFCHPEVEDRIRDGLDSDTFLRSGVHVDGVKMAKVDVDDTWPRWVWERKCPDSWWRPR